MELHYWEKQLILYTKGHYVKNIDYNKDLRHFTANIYGLYFDQVKDYMVQGMVVDLYEKLVNNGLITHSIETFIADIFKRSFYDRGSYEVNRYDIIYYMLGEIQGISVLNVGLDLGTTDDDLFHIINS